MLDRYTVAFGLLLLIVLPSSTSTTSCRSSHRFDGYAELAIVCVAVLVVVPVIVTTAVLEIVLISSSVLI